jgi:hypothetical protein
MKHKVNARNAVAFESIDELDFHKSTMQSNYAHMRRIIAADSHSILLRPGNILRDIHIKTVSLLHCKTAARNFTRYDDSWIGANTIRKRL